MALSKSLRFEVFKRDSFTCQYCGRSAPEVLLHADHIDPKANGGEDTILNLVTSCQDCNLGKGAPADPPQFYETPPIDITGGADAADYIEEQRGGDAETIDHYRRAGNWLSHQWAQDVGHAVPGLEDAWKATEEQP